MPPRPQLSYSVQQRRAIVDGLVADREHARYTEQVVRYRTGRSSLPPPPAPPPVVVPDVPVEPAATPAEAAAAGQAAGDHERRHQPERLRRATRSAISSTRWFTIRSSRRPATALLPPATRNPAGCRLFRLVARAVRAGRRAGAAGQPPSARLPGRRPPTGAAADRAPVEGRSAARGRWPRWRPWSRRPGPPSRPAAATGAGREDSSRRMAPGPAASRHRPRGVHPAGQRLAAAEGGASPPATPGEHRDRDRGGEIAIEGRPTGAETSQAAHAVGPARRPPS